MTLRELSCIVLTFSVSATGVRTRTIFFSSILLLHHQFSLPVQASQLLRKPHVLQCEIIVREKCGQFHPKYFNARHIFPASFPMNCSRFVPPSVYMLFSFRILFSRASQPIAVYSCGWVRCVNVKRSDSESDPRLLRICQMVPAWQPRLGSRPAGGPRGPGGR
jgi:hypothetical protein